MDNAMDNAVDGVRRSLVDAPPARLVEHLTRHLGAEHGVTEVTLLLVDYRLAELRPLPAGRVDGTAEQPAAHPAGAAWRCFDEQAPAHDGSAILVPVTVRSERLGVLRLDPGGRLEPAVALAVGEALAHEIAAARAGTDRYLVGARARRLTLAAEMQWGLLPGRSAAAEAFDLAGQLEPAYSVRGDTFDWAVNVDTLTLCVLNGMGEGVAAASLSTLATSAMRNARRAALPVAEQASLTDEALYAQFRGGQYVSAALLEVDLGTGEAEVLSTGSPLLMLVRDDTIIEVDLAPHDPLGMFEGTRYEAQRLRFAAGDRLIIVSDGIHEARSGTRQYGGERLRRLVRRTRGLAPLQVVRTVVSEITAFVAGPLDDDAAVVCLDWRGAAKVT